MKWWMEKALQSLWSATHGTSRGFGTYLEGHGNLVSRLIIRITRVTICVSGAINLVTKSPVQVVWCEISFYTRPKP